MKSFGELVHEPNFAIALIVAFMLAGWNLAYGSEIVGAILLFLIMGSIALNVWKTAQA